MKQQAWVLGLLALALLLSGAVWMLRMSRTINQPIAFNHAKHLSDAGLECTDCHLYAMTGVRATIPNIALCADCHEEAQTKSLEEARLVEHIADSTDIPWRKVYSVPDHVYFSHRRHTALAGIECDTCHGPVGQRSEPLDRPLVRLTMTFCMECHDASDAQNDCVLCHR